MLVIIGFPGEFDPPYLHHLRGREDGFFRFRDRLFSKCGGSPLGSGSSALLKMPGQSAFWMIEIEG
jgi:hypothetical protein